MLFTIIASLVIASYIYKYISPDDFEKKSLLIKNILLKNDLKNYSFTIGYNTIYLFSSMQIFMNRINKRVMPNVKVICRNLTTFLRNNYFIINTDTITEINNFKFNFEIYANGNYRENVTVFENNWEKVLNENLEWINDYDLIILSNKNDLVKSNNSPINKVFYYDQPTYIEYTVSNIKFFSVELLYNHITYSIQLQTDSYNYYVVNNIINRIFFKYYLTNILNIVVFEPFVYSVQIIDHNVNLIQLLPDQYLIIKENDYEIRENHETQEQIDETPEQIDETQEQTDETPEQIDETPEQIDEFVKLDSFDIQ